ncbi:hypothetical protein MJO29_015722 [Puccinia striiformis f. sp. tritici]|nr:hypothetical protein MJO29_015722 [Puccinia striiformis f. sp. tritici]
MFNYLRSDLDRLVLVTRKAPTTVGRPFDSRQTATDFLTPIERQVLRVPDVSSESHLRSLQAKGKTREKRWQCRGVVYKVTSNSLDHHELTNQTNMKSGFYASCFLVAFAAATPIEHQARQISSVNQASGSGRQSTSNSQVTPSLSRCKHPPNDENLE